MATVLESLKGINAYPIPLRTILDVGVGRKLPLDSDVDETILTSKAYQLATADLYYWPLLPMFRKAGNRIHSQMKNAGISETVRCQFTENTGSRRTR